LRNFDGIIFDVDGTLTSTNQLIFDTFNHVAKIYLGKEFSEEEIISYFGPTEDVILKEMMGEKYPEVRKEYFDFYRKNHKRLAGIYPGIEDILKKIKSTEIPISIYTGKGKDSTEITLKEIGVYNYFDMIVTGDDVLNHKPSAEGILKFVNKFNLNPSRVLMIGDAVSDIKASKDAGVNIASVLWDSYGKEKVLQMESDYIFHTVEELDKFISENI
jgi:HAD superfamily hydrolase (TIGR01549 family)